VKVHSVYAIIKTLCISAEKARMSLVKQLYKQRQTATTSVYNMSQVRTYNESKDLFIVTEVGCLWITEREGKHTVLAIFKNQYSSYSYFIECYF